ncbi:MAG: hypothetical protein HY215_05565 [Candidatus Rokubacteria bacterium]|nr:hypothetical protein [Candidatus Rokubacteria bacterium]
MVQPLTERADEARRLLSYVGAWAPPPSKGEMAWGVYTEANAHQQLIGAVLLERKGASGMLHGPVVVGTASQAADPIEIAAWLVGTLLPQAMGLGVQTLFARPQGLDRVWVRFGFIPVPEADLPPAFKGRPGAGLFAWRGGTALWSARRPEGDRVPPHPAPRDAPHLFSSPPHHTLSPSGGEDKGKGGEAG